MKQLQANPLSMAVIELMDNTENGIGLMTPTELSCTT